MLFGRLAVSAGQPHRDAESDDRNHSRAHGPHSDEPIHQTRRIAVREESDVHDGSVGARLLHDGQRRVARVQMDQPTGSPGAVGGTPRAGFLAGPAMTRRPRRGESGRMDDLPPDPPIIVMEPAGDPPYRRVEIQHQVVGKAYLIDDVIEFARRAGLEDLDPYDPEMVGAGIGVAGPVREVRTARRGTHELTTEAEPPPQHADER
jgi:hypothetical protein